MNKNKITNFNNGRIYSNDVIKDLMDRMKNFTVYGTLNGSQPDILLKEVSHIIKNIEVYDDGIYGEIQILDTPNGKIIKNIGLDNFSISERSFGHIDPDTNKVIVEKILTYDLIGDIDLLKIRRKKIEKIKKIIKENNGI